MRASEAMRIFMEGVSSAAALHEVSARTGRSQKCRLCIETMRGEIFARFAASPLRCERGAPGRTEMTRRSIARLLLFTVAGALAAATAAAQNAPPVRVRGVIETSEGQMIAVKARDGDVVAIKLADPVTVTGIVKASLADITVGSF